MKLYDKSQLAVGTEEPRRDSIMTTSDAGSEFEPGKKIKYGGPLAGISSFSLPLSQSKLLKTNFHDENFFLIHSCLGFVC